MKVKDLIRELGKVHPDLEVRICAQTYTIDPITIYADHVSVEVDRDDLAEDGILQIHSLGDEAFIG